MSRLRAALRRRRPPPGPDSGPHPVLSTATDVEREIVDRALPHSITSAERLLAVVDAVRYCTDRRVPGAFAECGVWQGGSVLDMILGLQDLDVDDRDLWLYDTFEGMTEPTESDTSPVDRPALETWQAAQAGDDRPWSEYFDPAMFNEERVRDRLLATGYPPERLHFVRGKVEDTLPDRAPDRLAFLRLDTDWYESTRHELVHLYPRLEDGGVLIVDDYGHWEGCRRAVDEYFSTVAAPVLLSRIDYTGRVAVKR